MADTTGLLVNAAACAFGFGVLHYVLQQLAQKLHPSDGPKARHEWANYVISCGQAAISGFAGAMGLLFEEPFASAFYQATLWQFRACFCVFPFRFSADTT